MKFYVVSKKMKKINNLPIIFLISFLALTSCQSLKEGLSGAKKNNSDEFLIEKKNPLTKPPDYDVLPDPDSEFTVEKKEDIFDLKKKLGKVSKSNESKSSTQIQNNNLEKSILEKIKKN